MKLNSLDRELTEEEINYVLFHLSLHIRTDMSLNYLIGYHKKEDPKFKGIEIYKSDKGIDLHRVEVKIGIPLLFPVDKMNNIYEATSEKIIVKHDLIKASFYLLSAYQEFKCTDLDNYGRFKWENSIQYKLNIIHKPIVNYYFNWLIEAISLYCKANSIEYEKINPLGKATLHLTHDIDLLRYFSPKKIAYRWAQILGLRKCNTDKKRLTKDTVSSTLKLLKVKNMDNPYWSFSKIINTENYYGYKSTWFFLPNANTIFDADYKIEDDDVIKIMNQLAKMNNDIGVHCSLSTNNADEIKRELIRIKNVCNSCSNISRAHFLRYNMDNSPSEYSKAGIEVDCSYGFSMNEGFRNSYCFPFFPFDHENQKISNIIEIPLTMMDTTILTHKKVNYDDIYTIVEILLEEVRKFGGVFSLLWHNSTFDEIYNPNILKFYEDLHHFFPQYNMQSLTTTEISNKIHSCIYNTKI